MQDELYHSEVYLGEDFSDGIRHWKYVKKERVNGKWRYYYSDAEYEKAKSKYNKAKANYYKDLQAKSASDVDVQTHAQLYDQNKSKEVANRLAGYTMSYYKNDKKLIESGKKYLNAKKNLKKVKIKTFARRTVAKGIAAVANFFSNLKKK